MNDSASVEAVLRQLAPESAKPLLDELASLQAALAALARFKAFVHSYLTQHGIPEDDPTNQHSIQGCRIGARLDLLLAERDEARQRVADLSESWALLGLNKESQMARMLVEVDRRQKAEAERDRLQNEVLGLQKANELYRKGVQSQCELMAGMQQELRPLTAERDALLAERDAERQRRRELEAMLEEDIEITRTLEAERDRLRARVAELEAQPRSGVRYVDSPPLVFPEDGE